MQVPSGAVYSNKDIQILRLMAEYGFVQCREKPFTLASGIQSRVYVFGREDLTDHPELVWQVGAKIAEMVVNATMPSDRQPCLIGVPVAGITLATAASLVSYSNPHITKGTVIAHRVMREVPKDHGAHKGWVNGRPDPDRHTYWRVDNVVTDGGSKLKAEERLQQDGYPTIFDNPDSAPAFIWIDRQQGGVARLRHKGYTRITVAYNLLDLTYAYDELGLWPKSAVGAVEEEIKAHQFLPES